MLICEDLSAYTDSNKIFANLGLCVLPGSWLFLKGSNGSGKTTLLKMLAGLNTPSSGKIFWQNREISADLTLYQSTQIAYLGHHNALKNDLTVLENLTFWAKLKNTMELIPASLSHFGLFDLIDTRCELLSAGQKRRVALSRLMLLNAPLWLIDEPENQLDKQNRERLFNLITVKVGQGGMVVISTHNLDNIPGSLILDMNNFS